MAGQVTPSPTNHATTVESEGGAVKASQILGSVAAGSGALGLLAPITAPITVPLGILAGLGSTIAGLFGGRLTEGEMKMLATIKSRVDQRKKMGME